MINPRKPTDMRAPDAMHRHATNLGMNGRQSGGFSLRRALENQGVTTEEEMRAHLATIARALGSRGDLDITRYRVRKRD